MSPSERQCIKFTGGLPLVKCVVSSLKCTTIIICHPARFGRIDDSFGELVAGHLLWPSGACNGVTGKVTLLPLHH